MTGRSRWYMIGGAAIAAAIAAAAIVHAYAATFDSDLVPSAGSTYRLGVSSGDWRSINNTIFFSGSNVGISNSSFSPSSRLDVQGDIRVESGDVYVDSSSHGLILKASNGSCWRLGVDTSGVVSATSTVCL